MPALFPGADPSVTTTLGFTEQCDEWSMVVLPYDSEPIHELLGRLVVPCDAVERACHAGVTSAPSNASAGGRATAIAGALGQVAKLGALLAGKFSKHAEQLSSGKHLDVDAAGLPRFRSLSRGAAGWLEDPAAQPLAGDARDGGASTTGVTSYGAPGFDPATAPLDTSDASNLPPGFDPATHALSAGATASSPHGSGGAGTSTGATPSDLRLGPVSSDGTSAMAPPDDVAYYAAEGLGAALLQRHSGSAKHHSSHRIGSARRNRHRQQGQRRHGRGQGRGRATGSVSHSSHSSAHAAGHHVRSHTHGSRHANSHSSHDHRHSDEPIAALEAAGQLGGATTAGGSTTAVSGGTNEPSGTGEEAGGTEADSGMTGDASELATGAHESTQQPEDGPTPDPIFDPDPITDPDPIRARMQEAMRKRQEDPLMRQALQEREEQQKAGMRQAAADVDKAVQLVKQAVRSATDTVRHEGAAALGRISRVAKEAGDAAQGAARWSRHYAIEASIGAREQREKDGELGDAWVVDAAHRTAGVQQP